jgi:hypothetical protein
MLEVARIAGPTFDAFSALFTTRWQIVGDALTRFFPDRDPSVSDEEVIAVVVGLTYGPVGSGISGHHARRLVTVTLEALLQGQRY